MTKYSILVTSYVELKSVSKPSGQSVVCISVMYLCSLHTSLEVAHQAGAYPGFSSMKQLGVFLLPPGWDASQSQSEFCQNPFIQRGVNRELSVLPKNI